jgi:phosphatidylglycerol:prolipoprotein diacylglycerol transferase
MFAILFPNIDPYIIRFGELGVTWYSLSYVTGILLGWKYASYLIDKGYSYIKFKDLDDYITWLIISIIVGGRLGYVILYDPYEYFSDPIKILLTYKGGMSFHGGLAGVIISSYIFCKKRNIKIFILTDLLAQGTPFGLFFGRIANFINGELYGHETNLPWGVIFPRGGDIPRHPSQIYEAISEGLILFFVIYYFSIKKMKNKKIGFLSGVFLLGYGLARFICEYFRIADFEFLFITSGQLYSVPMLIFGLYLTIFYNNDSKKLPS